MLDAQREEIDFDDGRGERLYGELVAGGALKARADRLVHEWERQRWFGHLARQ